MVVDTKYYDILQISPTANDLEIKKAYRRLAIQLHPDKNPNDESAHAKFQELGQAYQILSDKELRKQYDKIGPDMAGGAGDVADSFDFFSIVFGGQAFEDWIGEYSLIKNIFEKIEALSDPDEENNEAGSEKEASDKRASTEKPSQPNNAPENGESSSTKPTKSTFSTVSTNIPHRPAIKDKSEEELQAEVAGMTKVEKDRLAKEKRDAKMKAVAAVYEEQKRKREERISTLARKLVDRVSIWTETDKGPDVTVAFRDKIQLEIESLKMESFGVEILHAMGLIYSQKGLSFLRSQKFFGVTGFFNRAKDKVNSMKDTLDALVLAHDTQKSLRELELEKEEILKAEKAKGNELTLEQQVEFEKKASGTVLGAALGAHTYEIRDVLRDVCDKMLYDKTVKLEKRIERAKALLIIGDLCRKAERSEEEQSEIQAFEELVRDSAQKKGKTSKANGSQKTDNEKHENSSMKSPKIRTSDEKVKEAPT